MGGITGFWQRNRSSGVNEALFSQLKASSDSIVHRGPDSLGHWTSTDHTVGLAFRSAANPDDPPAVTSAATSMISPCCRYVVAFSGDIHNAPDLQKELHCEIPTDIATVLAALTCWGITESAQRFRGKFAFIVYDQQNNCLTLVRDRVGLEPIYYGWWEGALYIGSELKALMAYTDFRGILDRNALGRYLQHGYVPAPLSIFSNAKKLPPGTFVTIKKSGPEFPIPIHYWSLEEVFSRPIVPESKRSFDQSVTELDALLNDVIEEQMIANTQPGAFLSGGIDSSLVAALMQKHATTPVQTFSIGFKDQEFDEAPYAEAIARHLKTDHQTQYLDEADALEVIPHLADFYDEPFADSSQIPTFLAGKLAKKSVPMCLAGDGGDEFYGGYHMYSRFPPMEQVRERLSRFRLLKPASWALKTLTTPRVDIALSLLPGRLGSMITTDRLKKYGTYIQNSDNAEHAYDWITSSFPNPEQVIIGLQSLPRRNSSYWKNTTDRHSLIRAMMLTDSMYYLPDDILTKVDRANIQADLQTRAPLLDHRIIEFACSVPINMHFKNPAGKALLRTILAQHVPTPLFERPKQGFGIPLASWLRGELHPWAENLISTEKLTDQGIFNATPIRTLWDEHIKNQRQWQTPLWTILMFQAWFERYHEQIVID